MSVVQDELNRAFHFALAGAARMPLLLAKIENMWAQIGPLTHLYHLNTPKRDLVSKDHPHHEVLRALALRDVEAARAAIKRDIALGTVMVRWLEERGSPEGRTS